MLTRDALDLSVYQGRVISFSYPGGKASMAKELIALMPKSGSIYVEPFVGRGNVVLNVMHFGLDFEKYRLNDIQTAPFLRALRDHGDVVRCSAKPREAYYRHWEARDSGIITPHGLLNEPRNCFGAGTYGDSGPVQSNRVRDAQQYYRDLRRSCELLRGNDVKITAMDWKDLRWKSLPRDAFALFDPPYFGADVRSYTSNDFDYDAMVKLLENARFRWLLTEYEQPFYNKAFGKPIYKKETVCQLSRDGSSRTECVYTNF